VAVEQRSQKRLGSLVGKRNFIEWKNFVKRKDVSSTLIGILLDEAWKTGMFDYTMGNQKVESIVGETYAGKIFYFMEKYDFKIVDYEEATGEEGYRERLLEQARIGKLDPAFVVQLKGFFTIAVDHDDFVRAVSREVKGRGLEALNKKGEGI